MSASSAYDSGRSIFDAYASPIYIMAKPASALCNLDCRYCYYQEKIKLYGTPTAPMSDATLEKMVRQYIEAQSMTQVLFTWHGGEPLLRGLPFYRRAVQLQQYYGAGRQIDNCIQTNGLLLDDEWCKFLHDQGWLVGISIDGTSDMHDRYRQDHAGGPTHAQVMRAIEMLDRYDVQWNAMAVINSYNVERPLEFYNFFKSIDCRYLQFTPIVERYTEHADGTKLSSPAESGMLTPESISGKQWGEFLCAIFDQWVQTDIGQYFVEIFDATLANWAGEPPGICAYAPLCGHAGVMESNGDIYSCDHYVFPEYRLGNIHTATITEMMHSDRQRQFGASKYTTLPSQCLRCQWLFACHGECPKNRFALSVDNQPGLNHLCAGYQKYFSHTAPYMQAMLEKLKHGLPPSDIMHHPKP